jgi:hypothetical protein
VFVAGIFCNGHSMLCPYGNAGSFHERPVSAAILVCGARSVRVNSSFTFFWAGSMATKQISVQRFSVTSSKKFEEVVAKLAAGVGHPDMRAMFAKIGAAKS